MTPPLSPIGDIASVPFSAVEPVEEPTIPDSVLDQTTLRYEASTITASSGSPISEWSPSIGSLPITGNATYGVDNGTPFVSFDGTDDGLGAEDDMALSQPYTIIYAARQEAQNIRNTGVHSYVGGKGNAVSLEFEPNEDGVGTRIYSGSTLDSTTEFDGENVVWIGECNGSSSAMFKNSTQIASGDVGPYDFVPMRVGYNHDGIRNGRGKVFDVLVVDGVLSRTELEETVSALRTKHGF